MCPSARLPSEINGGDFARVRLQLLAPVATTTTRLQLLHITSTHIIIMALEEIFPGICLTLSEHLWSPENIRAHGFTHIIRIDRHMARKQQQQQTSRRREHAAKPADTDLNANVVSVADDAVEVDGLDDGGAVEANDDHLYAGFKTLDLNFGEDGVYLSTVLPNCYKGVTFIEAALRGGGAVLIIDRLSKQKSVTVVIGFLMYKHHIKFR